MNKSLKTIVETNYIKKMDKSINELIILVTVCSVKVATKPTNSIYYIIYTIEIVIAQYSK